MKLFTNLRVLCPQPPSGVGHTYILLQNIVHWDAYIFPLCLLSFLWGKKVTGVEFTSPLGGKGGWSHFPRARQKPKLAHEAKGNQLPRDLWGQPLACSGHPLDLHNGAQAVMIHADAGWATDSPIWRGSTVGATWGQLGPCAGESGRAEV